MYYNIILNYFCGIKPFSLTIILTSEFTLLTSYKIPEFSRITTLNMPDCAMRLKLQCNHVFTNSRASQSCLNIIFYIQLKYFMKKEILHVNFGICEVTGCKIYIVNQVVCVCYISRNMFYLNIIFTEKVLYNG